MAHLSESVSSRRGGTERAVAEPFDHDDQGGASARGLSSIQDVFLNTARRDRLEVTLHLMSGGALHARIKGFDRFAVVVDVNGADHLVFKHAIASIETSRSLPSYAAAHS